MSWRSVLPVCLFALVPTAALAVGVRVAPSPDSPTNDVAAQAVLGVGASVTGLTKLDFLAAMGTKTSSAVINRVEVVPEPTPGLLLLLGLVGLGLRRHRT